MNLTLPQIAFWLYAVTGLTVALYVWVSDVARERIKSVRSFGRFAVMSELTFLPFLLLWPLWLGVLWLAIRSEKRRELLPSAHSLPPKA